jgi:hypothetical protein
MGVVDDVRDGLAFGGELGALFLSVFVVPGRSVAS